MFGNNHSAHAPPTQAIQDQLDAIRESVRKLAARITGEPERSRLGAFANRASELVKSYPLIAAGVAVGLGYAIVKLVRR